MILDDMKGAGAESALLTFLAYLMLIKYLICIIYSKSVSLTMRSMLMILGGRGCGRMCAASILRAIYANYNLICISAAYFLNHEVCVDVQIKNFICTIQSKIHDLLYTIVIL